MIVLMICSELMQFTSLSQTLLLDMILVPALINTVLQMSQKVSLWHLLEPYEDLIPVTAIQLK